MPTDNQSLRQETTYELQISRLIDAPRERLFDAWTDPEKLKQWFCPAPFKITSCEIEPRTGGVSRMVMEGPDGTEYPMEGVYLEVVAPERIVTTDAYGPGWVPAEKPFFTAVITFDEEDGKTRYIARARHWTEDDMKQHEAMGFYEGWGKTIDQLEALVAGA